mmetsp:Transcript_44760/g.85588  ORF Transcript_44760/g.85588 Transcript_44760/m.85588 type:complete len:241 (+) Transcript_44760:2972-3694(+)
MRRRVSCLFLAASIAFLELPGRPRRSATLAARGTAVSQKVITPEGGRPSSIRPWIAATICSTTVGDSMSTGMNRLMMPVVTSSADHVPGLSMMTLSTPSCCAFSKMNFLPGYPAEMKTSTRSRSMERRCAWPAGVADSSSSWSSSVSTTGSLHLSTGTASPLGMMGGTTICSYFLTSATASAGVGASHMICPSHVGKPSSEHVTSSPGDTSGLAYTTPGSARTSASQSPSPITPVRCALK